MLYQNSNEEIVVSKPRKTTRKRLNGTDGEITILVGRYHFITARIDFTTAKSPDPKAPVWRVYQTISNMYGVGNSVLKAHHLTKQDALKEALELESTLNQES